MVKNDRVGLNVCGAFRYDEKPRILLYCRYGFSAACVGQSS